LRFGRGVPVNTNKAAGYFRQAVAQGYAPAEVNLAILTWFGYGVPKNLNEAARLMRDAAQRGLPEAQTLAVQMTNEAAHPPPEPNSNPYGGNGAPGWLNAAVALGQKRIECHFGLHMPYEC
jgi:TPR repeat protein